MCPIICLYVPCSVLVPLRFPHITMFGSSLPPVVSRRTDVLFLICLRIPGYLAGLIMLIFVVFSVLFCFVLFCLLFCSFCLSTSCVQCCQCLWIVHSLFPLRQKGVILWCDHISAETVMKLQTLARNEFAKWWRRTYRYRVKCPYVVLS